MQWLTPIKGILYRSERVRATIAHTVRGGPMPGPLV
jgi:hypothetical protein